MARGWESKSVESQMEDNALRHRSAEPGRNAADIRLETQLDGIRLSRERVLRELAESQHERRREQLREALAFLDAQIEALSPEPKEKARAAGGY